MKKYEPGTLARRSQPLMKARKWAIGLFAASVALKQFLPDAQGIDVVSLQGVSFAVSLVTVLALTGMWMWSTDVESDLLFEWLDPKAYEPPSGILETSAIIGFSLLMLLMLFTARSPLLFALAFLLYAALTLGTLIWMNSEIEAAIGKSRSRLKEDQADDDLGRIYNAGIDVLWSYFIRTPHVTRSWLILAFGAVAVGLGGYGRALNNELATIAAQLVVVSTIIVSEVTIAIWRRQRDVAMRPLAAELIEAKRSDTMSLR